MKMKKLLAGVLSAAMVATMIPVSMAMSSVSAAPEDSLVASYDFTKGETQGWAGYTVGGVGTTYTEGNANITIDENGVTMPAGTNNYSIANPLVDKVTDGFTVAVDVSIPAGQSQTEFEGLFGFNNHAIWNFMGVTNDGYTLRANCEPSSGQHWYDIVHGGTDVDFASPVRYVMTADRNQLVLYVNGEKIATFADGTPNAQEYVGSTTVDFANEAQYFNLGEYAAGNNNGTAWEWWGTAMTVSAVSFYNTALSADDVAALGAYEPPVEDSDAITASVVDVTGKESYEEGDTVSVAVQATGNVDLGGYSFTLKYDNTLLKLAPQEDSSDPDVVVSNDGENGVVVLKADLQGENSVALSDTAATLYTFNFTVQNVPQSKNVEFSLTDTMFAYYDDNGIPTEYELVPTLNPCTVSLKAAAVIGNPYDFNEDGAAAPNVLDVMALAQLIVDQDPMSNSELDYDVHKDEQYPNVVDVLDVMALARIVVNG